MNEQGATSPLRRAFLRIEELEAAAAASREPLALVGMACRFPGGADSPAALWELLAAGRDATGEIPSSRWDIARYFDPRPGVPGKMYTTRGGFLDHVDRFDAAFFGISPREAAQLDPQQRLLLEVAWEALEHAGIAPHRLRGSRTGVYVGVATSDYTHLHLASGDPAVCDTYFGTGTSASFASGRIAYALGLQGAAVSIDTACSSSLVALHLACRALRAGECDLALVGGVNLILSPRTVISMCQSRMMAPDGRCKTFDAAADGFGQAEGCAVVAVKRLADAQRDGDRILALVRGTAINQDGASTGLTAPNGRAQEAVIRAALADAGVSPHQVGYVEAHGTGTTLGDPIEVQALAAVYGAGRAVDRPLQLGSIKTNLGHLEAAAGLAGLLKVVLALQHCEIPRHLNFQNPNPHIPWQSLPVQVVDRRMPFAAVEDKRVAGLSSFGFSGTNAHILIEEAPPSLSLPHAGADRALHVFTLSARNAAALCELGRRYIAFVIENPGIALADIAWSANTGRSAAGHRLAINARDVSELTAALSAFVDGKLHPALATSVLDDTEPPRIAMLFNGGALPAPGTLEDEPVFREAYQRCETLFAPAPLDGRAAQFAFQWALYCLWRSWGIEPALVMGVGVGEYVAACAAHVFGIEDAINLLNGGPAPKMLSDPAITLISARMGRAMRRGDATRAEYWSASAVQDDHFADGIRAAEALGYSTFVTLGAEREMLGLGAGSVFVNSNRAGQETWPALLEALRSLYLRGAAVDWFGFDRPFPRRKVCLPTYAFQRERYWLDQRSTAAEPSATGHPHLSGRFDTAPGDVIFQSRLDPVRDPYLAEHVVHGRIVLPAAFYLEIIAAAVQQVCGAAALEHVAILAAVTLPVTGKDIQIIVNPGSGLFQFFSRDGEEWHMAVTGHISKSLHASSDPDGGNSEMETVVVDDFYAACGRIGLDFGPIFRRLQTLRRRDNEALGEIALPLPAGFAIHPAALDACLQTLAAALPGFNASQLQTDVYMPVGIDRFDIRQPRGTRLTSRMRFEPSTSAETRIAHGIVTDADGTPVVRITGLRLKRAPRAAVNARPAEDRFYETRWELSLALEPAAFDPRDQFLLIADTDKLAAPLRAHLDACGVRSTIARPGSRINAESCNRIVYFGDFASNSAGGIERCCRPLLDLLHGIGGSSARLWIVTTGAQCVGPDERMDGLPQSALWGMGKVIALEHPELQCVRIDLDPDGGIDGLIDELSQPGDEPLIAVRGGCRYVARLARIADSATPNPVELAIVQRGTASGVALRPAPRLAPAAGEVEIAVCAAGLNFRDVLNVLGMRDDEGPLGGEVAGVVTATGAGVQDVKPGDEVVAITSGGLGTHAIAKSSLVLPKPPGVDFATGAAAPFVYLTAHYALGIVGRMAKGERALIHAAAGGVGMAAVQLAQRAGLEIYATAGSPAKREYLQSLGIAHVFDSRSTAFADAIREATRGEGVDLVLNALTGPAIAASFHLLRAGGRFLEIGKAEIWSREQAAAANPLVEYRAIDLAEEIACRPLVIRPMLADLLAQLGDGRLRPLPIKTFPLSAAAEAIEHMARARHIGKVVLLPPSTQTTLRLPSDATYLISGGLSGLGLAAAHRLADRGARSLVLFGRNAPGPEAAPVLAEMLERDVRVIPVQADAGSEADMRALFAQTLAALPPLRGVIHCAGQFEEAYLARQDWERFSRVLGPKAAGAWLLHGMTEHCALDFFVMYSSASSLLGAPGQANYAAANAYLDGLAHYRRARGLPGQSINWGAWASIGVAARRYAAQHLEKQGLGEMPPDEALDALERVILAGWTQPGVLRADWRKLSATIGNAAEIKFFAHLAGRPGAPAAVSAGVRAPSREVREASPEQRRGIILATVRAQVAAVIELPVGGAVPDKQPLRDMGLDSLMAVELCNRLRLELGIEQPLPATVAFDHPTVAAFADYLAAEFFESAPATEAHGGGVLDRIEQMSDEDVERLLAHQISQIS